MDSNRQVKSTELKAIFQAPRFWQAWEQNPAAWASLL
jgi:hypothetical protein